MSKRRSFKGFRPCALCAILDGELLSPKDILKAAAAAIMGGVDMIQLRDKRASVPEFIRKAGPLAAICRKSGVPFIVNDRVEVAAAVGADGVHLGQGDLGAAAAKRVLGPGKLIGVSITNLSQARQAKLEGASYIGAGPVFGTPVKPSRKAKGIAFLEEASRLGIPLLAIGGIDSGNVGRLTERGIRSIAVIRAICSSRDKFAATRRLKEALISPGIE
jgi:thiamine-phosphate pyrophosphorylase